MVRARSQQDTPSGLIPADTLHMLPELIAELGGDAAALYRQAGLDAGGTARHGRCVATDAASRLLDLVQRRLACPDVGLQLGRRQRRDPERNLFELVMRHSPNLLAAFTWCARHCRTYSGSVGFELESMPRRGRSFVRMDIETTRGGEDRQLLELMLMRMYDIARDITGDRARPAEVWLRHAPIAPPADYQRHFGCPVRFGQPASGFFLDRADLEAPSVSADPQILELATYYIEHRFPEAARPLDAQVRALIARLTEDGLPCGSQDVAARLGLQYRTMQRRLRDDGTSFEAIKDEVRRDFALRCLAKGDVSLSRLAEMLGYAEVSALSRSCQRWFDSSPRCLRRELMSEAA